MPIQRSLPSNRLYLFLLLLLIPNLALSGGSRGSSCKVLFSSSTLPSTDSLETILIEEMLLYTSNKGPIRKFSQVISVSNQVMSRLKNTRLTEDANNHYSPTSFEAFLHNKIERFIVREGIKGILTNQSSPIRTSRLWQKALEYKDAQGNSFYTFLSLLYFEPVYKSIAMHSIKVVDEYIVPFINKGSTAVPFKFLKIEVIPSELLHSIAMEGISKEKVQKLHEIFGNGIYAEYVTTVMLKYLSRATWLIIIAMILDELHEQMKENKVYSFLNHYHLMGKDQLINSMVQMDEMLGENSDPSYYLGLDPHELLKEYQLHY